MPYKIKLFGMGGTVQQGLVGNVIAPKYSLEQLLDFVFKEDKPNIEAKELVARHNVDSNNISEPDFFRLVNEVYKASLDDSVDGILVTIGTDRLADIASLLEFTIRPINKPVVFTGAMHTIEEANTDVTNNIKKSIRFIEEILSQDIINKGLLYSNVLVFMGNYGIYAHSTLKIRTTEDEAFVCSANKPAAVINGVSEIKRCKIDKNNSQPKLYLPRFRNIKIESLQFGYHPDISTLIDSEAIIYVGTGDGNFPRDITSTMEILSEYYNKPQFVCSNVPIRNTLSNYEAGSVPEGVFTSVLPLHSTYSKLAVILGSANFIDPKEKKEFVIDYFKKDLSNEYLHILGK